MQSWQSFFTPSFRSVIHPLLSSLSEKGDQSGIALIASQYPNKVICGLAPPDVMDEPCKACAISGCPIHPANSHLIRPAKLPFEIPPDELPFEILKVGAGHSAHHAPLTAWIPGFWNAWQSLQAKLAGTEKKLGAMDLISKLATQHATPDSIQEQISRKLGDHCQVKACAAVLINPGSAVLFPSSLETEVADIGAIAEKLQSTEAISGHDCCAVKPGTSLGRTLAPLLQKAGLAGFGVVWAIRLRAEALPDGNQLWILFVGFSSADCPPSPRLDDIRLLAQTGLAAWDSARRVKEANARVAAADEETQRYLDQTRRFIPAFAKLVGEDRKIRDLVEDIVEAAQSHDTVLLVGPKGSGKTLVARLIHQCSPRGRFSTACKLMAEEIVNNWRIWSHLHPRDLPPAILQKEFPGIETLNSSPEEERRIREWMCGLTADTKRAIENMAKPIHQSVRPHFFALARMVHAAHMRNPLFNFYEYSPSRQAPYRWQELLGTFETDYSRPGLIQEVSHLGGSLCFKSAYFDDLDSTLKETLWGIMNATKKSTVFRWSSENCRPPAERASLRMIVEHGPRLNDEDDSGFVMRFCEACASVRKIDIPPLNERPDDIELLAQHFASVNGRQIDGPACSFLKELDWSNGNVRALEDLVKEAAKKRPEQVIAIRTFQSAKPPPKRDHTIDHRPGRAKTTKADVQRALKTTHGNVSKAADKLGVDRRTIQRNRKKFKIT